MIKHDLLGRQLEVVGAANSSLIGLKGEVVDETKNTITLRASDGDKKLLKEQVTIKVGGLLIEGRLLAQRPEKRTRNKIRTWQRKKPLNQ